MHAAYVLVALVSAGAPRAADLPAEAPRRDAEQQQAQARADEVTEPSCDAALDGMDAATIAMLPRCKAKKASFCRRLETREGLSLVLEQGEDARAQAAKLCGKDLARLQAALCPAAAKQWAKGGPRAPEALVFIGASCPTQATPIAKRECAGRSYTALEGAMRDFCTAFARHGLDAGEPKVAPARHGAREGAAQPEEKEGEGEGEEGKGPFGR